MALCCVESLGGVVRHVFVLYCYCDKETSDTDRESGHSVLKPMERDCRMKKKRIE